MYQVELDTFKGPIELLLYMVKKERLDIQKISLSKITKEYLSYLEERSLDLDELSKFLIIFSILIQLKSKYLLPNLKEEEDIEELQEESHLEEKIKEYRKYQKIAQILSKFKEVNEEIYTKLYREEEKELDLGNLKLVDLIFAFSKILKEFSLKEKPVDLEKEISIMDMIDEILKIIPQKTPIKFSQIFMNRRSRLELIVLFLALLELIRKKVLYIYQEENFSEIWIIKKEDG